MREPMRFVWQGALLLGVAVGASCGGTGGGHASASSFVVVPPNPVYLAYLADLAAGRPVGDYVVPAYDTASVAAARGIPPIAPPVAPGLCSFPAAFDLRDVGRVTPVRDIACGSCWTSASVGSLESYLAPGEIRDFSEAHMQLRDGEDDALCGVGANRDVATAYLAEWRGPVDEADFDPVLQPSDTGPNAPPVRKHVQNVYYLPDRTGPLDNCWIKMAVTYLGGVYSEISHAIYSPIVFTNDTYYHPTAPVTHAVTIVGWDDDFDRNLFDCGDPSVPDDLQVPPGDGAFIVKDNGGPNWLDGGYFYVSYYDGSIGQGMAAYTAEPLGNYGDIYQYDPYGPLTTLLLAGQKKQYSWQGNVFTARSDTLLAAVGLYELFDPSMDYQVQVFLDPTDGPVGGTPAATMDVSMWIAGYRTVKLPTPIPLHEGQRFGVVLRGHDREGGWPAALLVEAPDARHTKVTANPGESWVSTDGQTWHDLTKLQLPAGGGKTKTMPNANLCIKAFTRPPSTCVAHLDPGDLTFTWALTNDGSTDLWVRPAAQDLAQRDGSFIPIADEFHAATWVPDGGVGMPTQDGWILLPPGTRGTAFAPAGSVDPGAQIVAYRFQYFDAVAEIVKNGTIWKHLADLLAQPLHVTSTDPLAGAQVNTPLVPMVTATFDATIKMGPSFQGVSVTSDSKTVSTFCTISGDQLQVFPATPLSAGGLGGTTWHVHLPSDAVLSQTSGNPLQQDYDWSFTVSGVN
jgi:C1A family cysteine protease